MLDECAVITSLAGAVAKYCDDCVWVPMSVCLSARIYSEPHARSLPIFVRVAYVRGSVVLRYVDDRPHRLSPRRGDGSAQQGRSVIYDCLLTTILLLQYLLNSRTLAAVSPTGYAIQITIIYSGSSSRLITKLF